MTLVKSDPASNANASYCFGADPKQSTASCWRKNDTPSALMSGAIREARFSREAVREPLDDDTERSGAEHRREEHQRDDAAIGMLGSAAPPSHVSTKYPMYEPIMKTSPWAKLRSFRIPYTIE